MRPLRKHQEDALSYTYERLDERFTAWSELLYAEPPGTAYKYVREEWEEKTRDAEAACGVLIAHEMGLGKSAIAVRIAQSISGWVLDWDLHPTIAKKFKNPNILVVVPNIAKLNWQREWKMWSKPGEDNRLRIVSSDKNDFASVMLDMLLLAPGERASCIVMSYDTLRARKDNGLTAVKWNIVIYDEIQAFRNTDSQRSQAGMLLEAQIRIGLSGTPYTNKPDQLWSALAMLQGYTLEIKDWKGRLLRRERRSSIWGTRAQFIRDYCETDSSRYGTRVLAGKNLSNETCRLRCCGSKWKYDPTVGRNRYVREPAPIDECQSLHPRLQRELMHRVRTVDATDLPPWQLIDVEVDMTREQQKMYNKLLDGLLLWAEGASEFSESISIHSVLAQMTHAFTTCAHLGQLANGIAKRIGGDSITDHAGISSQMINAIPEKQRSGKMNWLLEFVDEQLNSDKMIVVTEFQVTANLIQIALNKAGCKTAIITGAVKNEQRDANVQAFMTDPSVQAIVINKAGYEAINLNVARYVVLFGKIAWTPGEVMQAIKRAHRLGTKGVVTVLRLYHEKTIECWLNQMLGTKAADFSSAIDGKQTDVAKQLGRSFSAGELMDIFQGRVGER